MKDFNRNASFGCATLLEGKAGANFWIRVWAGFQYLGLRSCLAESTVPDGIFLCWDLSSYSAKAKQNSMA